MTTLSLLTPWRGRPARVTTYTSGSGTHTWLVGLKLARCTVVGAGGAGGSTGKYLASGTYYYSGGGGGGAGAMNRALIAPDVAATPSIAYAVGAGASGSPGGTSYLGQVKAEGGLGGDAGSSSAATAGAAGAEAGRINSTIYTSGSITLPREPTLLPGQGGAAGSRVVGVAAGAGGSTLYGWGAGGVVRPDSGAPLAGLSPAAGQYGAGASGGTSAPDSAASYAVPASAPGAGGVIIIEEWT